MQQLDAIWQQIAAFGAGIADVPLDDIDDQLDAFEQEILEIIEADQPGTLPEAPSATASPSGTATSGTAEESAAPIADRLADGRRRPTDGVAHGLTDGEPDRGTVTDGHRQPDRYRYRYDYGDDATTDTAAPPRRRRRPDWTRRRACFGRGPPGYFLVTTKARPLPCNARCARCGPTQADIRRWRGPHRAHVCQAPGASSGPTGCWCDGQSGLGQ